MKKDVDKDTRSRTRRICRAIYYSDVATALIAYEAEVEYIEDGETHRTDLKSLIERHSVANGLACHEHLPILVTRFFVPAAASAPRVWLRARSRPIRS